MTPNPPAAPLLAALALAVTLLAGCTQAVPQTHLAIDFPDGHPDVDTTVPLADAATAAEQLLAWSQASGTPVAITTFSFGRCLDAIDDLPAVPGCSAGATAYWALAVDGRPAEAGMDDIVLQEGTRVTWTLTPLQATSGGSTTTPSDAPPAAASTTVAPTSGATPIGLRVDAPTATRNATLTVTGSLERAARLLVTRHGGGLAFGPVDLPAGPWSAEVAVDPGRSNLTITGEAGTQSQQESLVAVRLVAATFEALFTAALPPRAPISDEVWYDPDGRAALPAYDGRSVAHPPYATVHDLMVTWSQQSGKAIEYDYFDGLGFSPSRIDGVGQPLTSAAPPYWCYQVNGATVDFGITLQAVQEGDVVTWEYGACA